VQWQSFRSASISWITFFLCMCLCAGSLFAQQAPAANQVTPAASSATGNSGAASSPASGSTANSSSSSAPAAAQTPSAPANTAAQPAAGAQAPAQSKPAHDVKGYDSKRGMPYYEEIQEDWSSLQIGTSKLEPQPAMVGAIDDSQPAYTKIMARVQWRPGDPIDLWIYLPKGVKKPPVVLYLYGPSRGERFNNNDWATRVTSGGVAAVGFYGALMGARFHDRPMNQWFVSELQESVGSTVHDVKFILDYLDKSGQVDMNRVGMFGEGIGGSIAILAAAADPRIKVIDTLEPWGDWPVFLTKSEVVQEDSRYENYGKPEFLKKVAPLEPTKWLADLKIPIRIQQVKETEALPEECKDAIKAAAPKQAEVDRFVTVADLTKLESGGKLFQWVKNNLPKASEASKAADVKTAVVQKISPDKAAAQK
jgi:hypothetical protein